MPAISGARGSAEEVAQGDLRVEVLAAPLRWPGTSPEFVRSAVSKLHAANRGFRCDAAIDIGLVARLRCKVSRSSMARQGRSQRWSTRRSAGSVDSPNRKYASAITARSAPPRVFVPSRTQVAVLSYHRS